MTNNNVLTQYQSEALEALKSVANLGKPFEKVIMDTLKLFMVNHEANYFFRSFWVKPIKYSRRAA